MDQLDQSQALTLSEDFLLSSNQVCDMLIHIEKCWFQSEI